jgi:hypothetical protein
VSRRGDYLGGSSLVTPKSEWLAKQAATRGGGKYQGQRQWLCRVYRAEVLATLAAGRATGAPPQLIGPEVRAAGGPEAWAQTIRRRKQKRPSQRKT